MKRAITSKVSKKMQHCFIALLLVVGLQSNTDLYGQCQGFSVSVDAPPWYTFCAGDLIDLTATVTGGTGPFTYSWSTGGTGPVETIIGPSSSLDILLTVTDANGCVANATAHIKPQNIIIFITASGGPACEIVENIILEASSTTYPATFLWSTGESTPDIIVNTPGTYTVTATDPNSGCTAEASVTPTFFPLPEPEILGDNLVCPGISTTLSVTGGTFTAYSWAPGGKVTPEITIDIPGTYSVTVEDENGCPGEDDFEVLQFPLITPTLSAPPFLCPESEGTVEVVNFTDYVSYSWSNGQSTASTVGFPAENYEVTVTDFNGCTQTESIAIGMFDVIFPSIFGASEICEGQESVDLTVYPPFEAYEWSTSETTQTINVNEIDLYMVTVTDANGCTTQEEHNIFAAPVPEPFIPPPPASCAGNPVELTVNGGPYPTYEWSNGETDSTITVNQSGTYAVTISNVFGCTAGTDIEVNLSAGPTAAISPAPYDCSGSVMLTGSGGSTYEWSNGETTASITVQTNGSYTVTVTDASGCTDMAEEAVDIPAAPQVSINGPAALCAGASDNLAASVGFDQYLWSGGETTAEILVSQPGTYTVTVTDNNGCTATESQTIATAPSPEPTITGPIGFCEGASATLNLSESFSQIIWSNGDETQSTTVSQPATYMVTVTDAAGCTGTDEWAVEEFDLPTAIITGPASICSGSSANFSVSGNFSQINWSTGESTPSINITSAGNYQVTVTDANGCTDNDDQELEIESALTPVIAATSTACDGTATLDVGSGYADYLWSNGSTGTTITINNNGSYSVTVSDGTGCTGEDVMAVTIPASPTINITGPAAVCTGETATLAADLGFVSYEWSSGETTANISISLSGTYSVVATDANGCTAEASQSFDNYPLPTAAINGPASICTGSTASLEVSGSFAQINWNTGEATPNINVSNAGNYSVTVTDANGCTDETAHELETGDSLTPVITSTGNDCNGMATLDAGDGFATYLWSNGETGQNIIVTANGNYLVTVSDASGCSGTADLDVNLPAPPQVNITGPVYACEGETVTLTADAGFVSYEWSNGETTSNIDISQTGIYEVLVTDASGCTASAIQSFDYFQAPTAIISGPASICSGSNAQLSVLGNFTQITWNTGETTGDITVAQAGTYSVVVSNANDCTAEAEHELEIGTSLSPIITTSDISCDGWATLDAGGGFSEYIWSNGETEQNITVDANGIYAVTVSDGTGCSGETTMIVNLPVPPVVEILGSSSICTGSSTEFSVPNNFPQIEWNTGEMTATIIVSAPGIYSVTITDANGCTSEDEMELDVSSSLLPDITEVLEDCNGTSTLDAGSGFTNYQWSTGSINQSIVITSNGLYEVTVSDASGCSGTATINVTLPDAPIVNIVGALTLCEGDETMLAAPGSFSQYLWNTGETTPAITVTQGGIYSVTVSNLNGCTATDEWVLIQLQSDNTFIQVEVCSSLDTGTVEMMLTNQFGCDSLIVTNIALAPELTSTVALSACEGSSAQFDGVQISAGGTQQFIYNASNGCDSVVTVHVEAQPAVDFELTATETCWNTANGSIEVSMLNGSAPYQYALNGGSFQTTPVFMGLPDGEHVILVSDANGCVFDKTIDISQTDPVEILIEDSELTCDESTVILRPTIVSGNLANIQWQWPDGSTDAWMMVETPGNYLLQVNDGCEEQEFPINVSWANEHLDNSFFYIPNCFSPNFDGINDEFRVYPGVDFEIKSFEFRVFDRWGDMMFGTTDVLEGWNGMYRGMQKQPAVYVWYVKAKIELCGGRELDFFKEGGVSILD